MTELDRVRGPRLRAILEEFTSVTWPMDRSILPGIADRLGWTLWAEVANGIDYRVDVGGSPSLVSALIDQGVIAQVRLAVTPRVDKVDATQQQALRDAFTAITAEVEQRLGSPAHRRQGRSPVLSWELENRGRIKVLRLAGVVNLVVLQQRYADVERSEESRGLSSDRVPGSDVSSP